MNTPIFIPCQSCKGLGCCHCKHAGVVPVGMSYEDVKDRETANQWLREKLRECERHIARLKYDLDRNAMTPPRGRVSVAATSHPVEPEIVHP